MVAPAATRVEVEAGTTGEVMGHVGECSRARPAVKDTNVISVSYCNMWCDVNMDDLGCPIIPCIYLNTKYG